MKKQPIQEQRLLVKAAFTLYVNSTGTQNAIYYYGLSFYRSWRDDYYYAQLYSLVCVLVDAAALLHPAELSLSGPPIKIGW